MLSVFDCIDDWMFSTTNESIYIILNEVNRTQNRSPAWLNYLTETSIIRNNIFLANESQVNVFVGIQYIVEAKRKLRHKPMPLTTCCSWLALHLKPIWSRGFRLSQREITMTAVNYLNGFLPVNGFQVRPNGTVCFTQHAQVFRFIMILIVFWIYLWS